MRVRAAAKDCACYRAVYMRVSVEKLNFIWVGFHSISTIWFPSVCFLLLANESVPRRSSSSAKQRKLEANIGLLLKQKRSNPLYNSTLSANPLATLRRTVHEVGTVQ